ncbi:hypothetical protein CesoFtcFv8_021383 [Champsocephalus esox]|nr:hypothetical protein CesoFtcFv8_021383 [Champsocephalus esox]
MANVDKKKPPLPQTLNATYVSDEADMFRTAGEKTEGGKGGIESCCSLLRSQRPRAGRRRQSVLFGKGKWI